jgi:O-antigen/teichoic acid export membrane protein
MGFERALTRHVAAELAVGRADLAWSKARHGWLAVMAASVAVAAVLAAAARPIAAHFFHQPDLAWPLQLAAIVIPLNNAAFAAAFILMGLDRGVMAQVFMNACAPMLALGALALGVRGADGLLLSYSGALIVAGVGAGALILYETRRERAPAPAGPAPAIALPTLWQSAKPLFVYEVGQAFLLSLPIIALGHFADPANVSEFSIASRLSMLVSTIVISIGQFISPTIARHYRRGEMPEMRHAYQGVRVIAIALCVPILLLMVIEARPLLTLLGSASTASVAMLRILALGQLFYCVLPGKDMLLAMTGHGEVMRRLMLIQLAAGLVMAVTIIPLWDGIGAALVSLVQWSIVSVGCAIAVRRLLPQMYGAARIDARPHAEPPIS